jgi:hypothetical protein
METYHGDSGADLFRTRRFLAGIAALPPDTRGELPVLADIAVLCGGSVPSVSGAWGPVLRGLNRRYRRICFVQDELERLDFRKAGSGAAFNDFVFDQIDFSVYKKIADEDFALFSGEGLEDFESIFFEQSFHLNREKVKKLIAGAYTRTGGFYRIKQENLLSNPLLMSLLRTLHTSLAFTPLFTADLVLEECKRLRRFMENPGEMYGALLKAMHGAAFIHTGGIRTDLYAVQEENTLTLRGVFHPNGKAYTIVLAKSKNS